MKSYNTYFQYYFIKLSRVQSPWSEAYSKCNVTREKYWNKFHNSFSIANVDITQHANSPERTQNEHFSKRNALSTQNSIKTSKKINSNMAYNDSWSTWEQKGRAEARREKNTWRVKTTARKYVSPRFVRLVDAIRPLINFAIAFDPDGENRYHTSAEWTVRYFATWSHHLHPSLLSTWN